MKKWIIVLLMAFLVLNNSNVSLASDDIQNLTEEDEEMYEKINLWTGTIEAGDRVYWNATGEKSVGVQVIEGKTYYFDEFGNLQTGWCKIDNTDYYFSLSTGERYENRTEVIDGIEYVFDVTGLFQKNENIIENVNENIIEQNTDSDYEKNDIVITGWQEESNQKKYYDADGNFVTGMQVIGDKKYYFNDNGVLQYGWIEFEGKKYYGMPDGSLRVGWLSFGETYYYCGTDGAIMQGVQTISGKKYYFNEAGVRQTGWIEFEGEKYYGMPDGSLRIGWLSFGKTYYYCGANGYVLIGENAIDGVLYTFDENGVMEIESGWGEYKGNKYYKNPSTGFPYMNQWVTFGKTQYYANGKGFMVSGWQTIGQRYYYFYPDTNIMARDTTIDGYKIGADGARIPTVLISMLSRVNNYSSPTSYLLMVDCNAHMVGVFKGSKGNWINLYAWECANGAPATPTVKGVFSVGSKGYYFDSGASRCFWYTQFYKDYLFHTILCNKDGSIQDGRVGMALSHGCVRLEIPNAKWIYDNIPRGTTVVIF